MSHRWRIHLVRLAVLTALTALPQAAATAQPLAGSHPISFEQSAAARPLVPLTELSAERALLSDEVAAAKWGTGKPIADPAREQQLLDEVARRSTAMGLDPAAAARVFRDHIEASELVQRSLHQRWTAHPGEAPTEHPDLPTEVRPELDRITTELLEQLRNTSAARERPSCPGHLMSSIRHVDHAQHLDALHRTALARSLPSACHPAAPRVGNSERSGT